MVKKPFPFNVCEQCCSGDGTGGDFAEQDPTVPDWAKQPKKPTYTADEVGALPKDTTIPTKVSELENDKGYLVERYEEREEETEYTMIPFENNRINVGENDLRHDCTVNGSYSNDIPLYDANGELIGYALTNGTSNFSIDFNSIYETYGKRAAYYTLSLPVSFTVTVVRTIRVSAFATRAEVDNAINNAIGVVLGGES